MANHFIWGACVLQYLEEGAQKCPMIISSHLSPSLKIAVESAFLIVSHLCSVTLWINREWFWRCPANSCNIYGESHHSDWYSSVPVYCMPPQFLHSGKKLLNVCTHTFAYSPSSSIVVITTDNVSVLYCWHRYLHNTGEEHTNILYGMILRCNEIWLCIKIINLSFLSSFLPLFVRVCTARDLGSPDQPVIPRNWCIEDLFMWFLTLSTFLNSEMSQAWRCQTLTGGVRNME